MKIINNEIRAEKAAIQSRWRRTDGSDESPEELKAERDRKNREISLAKYALIQWTTTSTV